MGLFLIAKRIFAYSIHSRIYREWSEKEKLEYRNISTNNHMVQVDYGRRKKKHFVHNPKRNVYHVRSELIGT